MIKLTWLGTATILLDVQGEKLLFDPFFRMNQKLEQPPLKTFSEVDYIFNTHAHLDHASSLPLILKNTSAIVYAPPSTLDCLKREDVDLNKTKTLQLEQKITTKFTKVITHENKHIKFDFPLILKTIFRSLAKFQMLKAIKLLKLNKKYQMKDDIFSFEVQAENKKLLIIGSAGYEEDQEYPKDVDILVWPFQGRSNMEKYSMPIIEKINPKTVILDHFDNSYPPITTHVKTNNFIETMKEKHPEINVIEPEFGESITLD